MHLCLFQCLKKGKRKQNAELHYLQPLTLAVR